jgi:hypothetical protein
LRVCGHLFVELPQWLQLTPSQLLAYLLPASWLLGLRLLELRLLGH